MMLSTDPHTIRSRLGTYDRTVRIWSVSTLSEVHVLKGHSNYVMSVAFSHDNAFLVSGSVDKTVRVWNVQTGEAVGVSLTEHTGWIFAVAFSLDGREFASGALDGTIRTWEVPSRTDLVIFEQSEADYSELNDEELYIRWNRSRASYAEAKNDGWFRDGEKLLLWVPLQYRHDMKVGTRLVIGEPGTLTRSVRRPGVDYRNLFRFSGTRWKDIYMGNGKGKGREV